MLLFVIETYVSNDCESDEVVLEKDDSILTPHKKESSASKKNYKMERANNSIGKTTTEETTETGTVSCLGRKDKSFCFKNWVIWMLRHLASCIAHVLHGLRSKEDNPSRVETCRRHLSNKNQGWRHTGVTFLMKIDFDKYFNKKVKCGLIHTTRCPRFLGKFSFLEISYQIDVCLESCVS